MNAIGAYKLTRTSIDRMLAELRCKLDEHAARAATDPRNWEYVIQLGHIRGALYSLCIADGVGVQFSPHLDEDFTPDLD